MPGEEVDTLDAIMDYVVPMQHYVNHVQQMFTLYELNGLVAFLQKHFDAHSKFLRTTNGCQLLNKNGTGVEVEIRNGIVQEFVLYDNPAVGLVRAKKGGGV